MSELATADAARAAQIVRELEHDWSLSGSTSIDLLVRRGEAALEAEDWDVAVEQFTAVTDHAPDFGLGWRLRAVAFWQSGRLGLALGDLAHALTLNPNDWEALYGLAMLMDELGRSDRAARALQMILDLNPHDEDAKEALDHVGRSAMGETL